MSIMTLFQNNPELIRGTTGDVLDASKARADYESAAPTGVSALPSMADIEQWENMLIGLRTNTGQLVTPERAKRNATVLAIMRGLEEDISSLALPLHKRGDKEDSVALDHPVHRIMNVAPNDVMTPMEVRGHMMFNMMTSGGFFNLKNFSNDLNTYGDIESIWPLEAVYVTRRWRELVWTFTDPTTGVSGTATPDTLWRGSILSSNGIDGLGITLLCREAIGMLLAAEEQGARLFRQGVQTDLALELPPEASLGDEEKAQLRSAFMARHSGSQNAFMPLLLEGGMKANKIGLTAQESQYLEARAFQVAEIARVFRYPEVLLGTTGKDSKSSTYASAESFFDSYTKHTLGPWTTRIEQTIHRDMLTPKEQSRYYCKHDFSTLLRANETARIANWNAKIQGGWAQPAEARRAENMPWKDGLEYFSRPAGSTGTAGPQSPDPTQTDQSSRLARRVALHIFNREEKALLAQKQDADSFYTNFGAYIEGMTDADPINVRRYLEVRRNTPTDARFSVSSMEAALTGLTNLCQGHSL